MAHKDGMKPYGHQLVKPYDAMVYIDGGRVYAVDRIGEVIAKGAAGTDDRVVIQGALTYLSTGGTLYIDTGNYVITTSGTHNAITLTGVDNITVILDANATFTPSTTYDYNIFYFHECDNLHISGGVFNGLCGSNVNDNDAYRNFILIGDCDKVTISDIYGYDIPTGIICLGGTTGCVVRNITGYGLGSAEAHFIHLHGYPVGVSSFDDINEDITICECNLDGNIPAVLDTNNSAIAAWGTNTRLTIANNKIIESGEYGIYVYEAFPPYQTTDLIINGNTVIGHKWGIQVHAVTSAPYVVITSNVIKGATERSCNLYGHVVLEGNIIDGGTYAVVATLVNTSGSIVCTGNEFNNQTYRNAHFISLPYVLATDNMGTCSSTYSLRIESCGTVLVDNNVFNKAMYETGTSFKYGANDISKNIRPVIAWVSDILGTPKLIAPCYNTSGTTVTDYSRLSNSLTTSATLTWYMFQGESCYYEFNGTSHYLYRNNDTDFDFGNSVTDSAFSLVVAVNPDNVTSRQIIGKWDVNNLREWRLFFDASGYPTLQLYDESIDKYIGRQDQTAFTTGTWKILVATYDGSGICAGCKIYIDGVQLDDADYTDAGYVAMEAINANLTVGALKNAAAYSEYYDGKMTWIGVAAKELSADEVWSLTQRLKGVLGI